MGTYKVYIIDEVHMLSAAAFNAFLKTLEEPPPYAKFILATTEKHKIIPTILSRCQIFDFKRITTDDIVKHLQFVASNESITADENALHIIAQKADGAMRDALSIFDQLVSFSGSNITYNTVLENLNVLDFEYFFKITGEILQSDISSTLLTINDILEKGFDGQHFLIGFGEHLRNLLVSKDPMTIKLMETAPSIRNRYLEQAKQCKSEFLLKALDIINKCDQNYKISNSKRLIVELALMQICLLSNPEKEAASPVQKSKPVSTQSSSEQKKVKGEQEIQPPLSPGSDKPKESQKLPGTFSIKDNKASQEKEASANISFTEEELEQRPSNLFTSPQLEKVWDEFSKTLEHDFPHLYSALRKNRPVLRENFLIEYCVDNKILAEALGEKMNDLLNYLMIHLNNYRITMQVIIPEHPVTSKPYTTKEKFTRMSEKNPTLLDLREQLDLEID